MRTLIGVSYIEVVMAMKRYIKQAHFSIATVLSKAAVSQELL
jgi:hypothetical protein